MVNDSAVPPEIRTCRLLLRPPTMDDADAYVAIASDPAYGQFGSRADVTRESVVRGLKQIVASSTTPRTEFAVVWEGEVVGRVILDIDRLNQVAALGYGIGRSFWGRGFASEAASAAIGYAFAALGVAKVWARADPRNGASVRVLEKLGMQREGFLRKHLVFRGERADRVYYGLLREEWEARATP